MKAIKAIVENAIDWNENFASSIEKFILKHENGRRFEGSEVMREVEYKKWHVRKIFFLIIALNWHMHLISWNCILIFMPSSLTHSLASNPLYTHFIPTKNPKKRFIFILRRCSKTRTSKSIVLGFNVLV